MLATSKLYYTASEGFRLPQSCSTVGSIIYADASKVTSLYWPNGRLCLEASMFLLELFESNLSIRGRGGSILVYASQISHLVRYCYRNNIGFLDLTDNAFSQFVRGLNVAENKARTRAARTIVAIGEITLRFLSFVGHLHGQENFVGPGGTIRTVWSSDQLASRHYAPQQRFASHQIFSHRSLPQPSPVKRGMPISSADVQRLRAAVIEHSASGFLRMRRQVTMLLLEVTGGRISEVVLLNVDHIKEAIKLARPMLPFPTLKRGGNNAVLRHIPVALPDLLFIDEYIRIHRRRIIRRTVGVGADHGYLLVAERGGRPLSGGYIGTEMSRLRSLAGLEGKAHCHMFRHRFITKLFKQLIEIHKFENPDAFRQALFNLEGVRAQVMEWTGHRSLSGFSNYIHLAFEEHEALAKSVEQFQDFQLTRSIGDTLTRMASDLEAGADPVAVAHLMQEIARMVGPDLD